MLLLPEYGKYRIINIFYNKIKMLSIFAVLLLHKIYPSLLNCMQFNGNCIDNTHYAYYIMRNAYLLSQFHTKLIELANELQV